MKHVQATVEHDLGTPEACRRLKAGFSRIREQMQIFPGGTMTLHDHWEGNVMHFEGQALGSNLTGRLSVFDKSVQIELDLPDFIGLIADNLRGRLERETRLLLSDRSSVSRS